MLKRLTASILVLMTLWAAACGEVSETLARYPSIDANAVNKTIEYTLTVDDDWFDGTADTYDHRIACASICMATSAFRADAAERDCNLRTFFSGLGMENYEQQQFDVTASIDTIASGMAMKRLSDDEGGYVLLAVGISGQGYGNEWLSNFTVNDGRVHAGFAEAAVDVIYRILDYSKAYFPGERYKLWISGFSRAAAVANLVAGFMCSQTGSIEALMPCTVFAYTFGTPNVIMQAEGIQDYPIYNICGSFDPVPRVPLDSWGYTKNGKMLFLPSPENADCAAQQEKGADVYEALTGNRDGFYSHSDRNMLIRLVLALLQKNMPDASAYADGIQQAIIAAWECTGTASDRLETLSNVLEVYYTDDEIKEVTHTISAELGNMLGRGLYDSLGEMSGSSNTGWLNLLGSGKEIAHDHYPEVYMAQMLSTDDPQELFGHDAAYTCVFATAVSDMTVEQQQTDGSWIDISGTVSRTTLGNELFINLPGGKAYRVCLTVAEGVSSQAGWSIRQPRDFADTNHVT